MRLEIAYITPRKQRLKSPAAQALLDDFISRTGRYLPTSSAPFDSETSLLTSLDKAATRTSPVLILLDRRGEALTSEGWAERLRRLRDEGTQHLTFAIGPPDGWSTKAWDRAQMRFSLGAITLAHELALIVLAEQLYRAQTILAGHPYHFGHG